MRKQPVVTFNNPVLRRTGDQVHVAWAPCEPLVNIAFAISNNPDPPGSMQHTSGCLRPIQPALGFLVGRATRPRRAVTRPPVRFHTCASANPSNAPLVASTASTA